MNRRMLSFLTLVVLSVAPFAFGQRIVDVSHAELTQVDGGVVSVDGGAWLSTDRLIEYAQTQKDLKAQAANSSPPWVIVVAAALGLVGGVVLISVLKP